MSPPLEPTYPDLAAGHARALLRACDLDVAIADRARAPSPALEWARSGAMTLTGAADGAPRFAAGGLAAAAAGAGMVLRALAPGTELAALDAPALLGERAAIAGFQRHGRTSAGGSARLLETKHDAIALNLPRDDDWRLVPAWLEADDAAQADGRDWKRVAKLLAAREATVLEARGRLMGLAVASACRSIPRDRPLFTRRNRSEVAPGVRERPIRLLDLSNLWAGPLATSLLAMSGIEVLKLESPQRPDGARRGPSAFFDLMNAGKRGVALDLRLPRDRTRFERVLDHVDIVVESARARALAGFGFDAEIWVGEVPGRIWASITGHGRSHEWIAFGDDAAIAAGLAWSPDPADRDPTFCADAIADPIAGLHVAAIVLAHLRGGRGGLLDLSLVDIAANAASTIDGRLHMPVERIDGHWHAIDDHGAIPIAPPRRRTSRGTAPALVEADDEMIDAWIAEC